MFGLEGKLVAIGGAILGFLALLLGAFFKGRSGANKQHELDTLRAAREAQVRVGEATAKDAQIDAEAARKTQEAKKKLDEGGRQADGTFKL